MNESHSLQNTKILEPINLTVISDEFSVTISRENHGTE